MNLNTVTENIIGAAIEVHRIMAFGGSSMAIDLCVSVPLW